MMMSCPIQSPANLFCAPASAVAMVGGGSGAFAELMDMGGAVVPQPLLANPHPLFPAHKQTTNNGEVEVYQQQQQQHHQHQTATPGAWFFQQSPVDGADVASVTILGLPDSNSTGLASAVQPPTAQSPPPGSLAQQQLLARFGPRHTTESVEVPSSEHVAEIVGRQGCKIKALRAKTNTYIKTPVRGEEPVFVVTGRHEDVLEAKREIECAAEHFTQIRASRRHSQGGCPAPGHVTAYVRVPLRVVGLVVGPKGNTIKRIQQDTHTYIITPSREREPIFEVTGLPQNVEAARREIEQHIYQRTGNMPITDTSASIANFDLHNAALQAQHAALHANTSNRPNYGALAVTSTMARQFKPQQQQSILVPAAQHQQFQSLNTFQQAAQFNHQQGANMGLSLGDLNGCFRNPQHDFVPSHHIGDTKLYSSATASPPPFGPIGGTGAAAALLPSLGTSASNNNLHALLDALELDSGAPQQQGRQQQSHFSPAGFKLGSLLLRSSSNGHGAVHPQQQQPIAPSAFSPWRMPSGAVDAVSQNDFLDMLSSTSPSPLFSASSGGSGSSGGGGCNSSSYSGGSCGIGGFVGGAGLSSVNSTSRDEGLGDSPTNSFGRPIGPDPYQHLMTIWADVCDQTSLANGADDCVKSASDQGGEQQKDKIGGELKIIG